MPAQAAPDHIHLNPHHRTVRKRDACLARATTALQGKIARASRLPFSASDTGQYRQHQETGAAEKMFHHCTEAERG